MPSLEEFKQMSSRALDSAKQGLGIERSESQDSRASQGSEGSDMLEELSDMCPKLTFQQRLIGFASSFGLGYLITMGSFGKFIQLIEGNPLPFVFVYTFGNILTLMSYTFLVSPKRQMKKMFDKHRKWTSIVYLSSLACTLLVAFIPFQKEIKLLVLILLLIAQFCASVWYSLSYIPYGRQTALRCIKGYIGIEESDNNNNNTFSIRNTSIV